MNLSYNNNLGNNGLQSGDGAQAFSQPGLVSQTSIGSVSNNVVMVEQKKSKKRIILLIVLILVLLTTVIGVIIWQRVGQQGVNRFSDDFVASFNRYANYMYSGEESDTLLATDIPENAVFEFQKKMYSDDMDARKKYFDTSKKLLQGFQASVNDEEGLDDELQIKINSMVKDGEFLFLMSGLPLLEVDDIMEIYYGAGSLNVAKAKVGEYYLEWVKSKDEDISQYGKDFVASYENVLDNIDRLNAAGCINEDREINEECATKVELTSSVADEERVQALELFEKMGSRIDSTKIILEKEIRDINSMIRGDVR